LFRISSIAPQKDNFHKPIWALTKSIVLIGWHHTQKTGLSRQSQTLREKGTESCGSFIEDGRVAEG